MSETAEFWRSNFGTQYTARNQIDPASRVPFWQKILAATHAQSVLEIGCNNGTNLRAIRTINPDITLQGVDVNQAALAEAADHGIPVTEMEASEIASLGKFDLIFTAGVLIHVSSDQLPAVMDAIIGASRQHVLAVEYADDTEVEVNYRSHAGKLWRRPFGRLYQEKGLRIISSGDAPAEAFDKCGFWLMEVPA